MVHPSNYIGSLMIILPFLIIFFKILMHFETMMAVCLYDINTICSICWLPPRNTTQERSQKEAGVAGRRSVLTMDSTSLTFQFVKYSAGMYHWYIVSCLALKRFSLIISDYYKSLSWQLRMKSICLIWDSSFRQLVSQKHQQ